jgi:hypothetical protein
MNESYKKSTLEYRLERLEIELEMNDCDKKHIIHKEQNVEMLGTCHKCFAFWEFKSPVLLEFSQLNKSMSVIYNKLDEINKRLKKLEKEEKNENE